MRIRAQYIARPVLIVQCARITCTLAFASLVGCGTPGHLGTKTGPLRTERSRPPQQLGEEETRQKQPTPVDLLPSTESEFSLELLERVALSTNPSVAQAASRLRALEGKRRQVGLPPNPTAGYVAEEIGDDGNAGKQGGFLGQRFVTGSKLRLNRRIVDHEIARAEQELSAQEERVRTDVRTGYYEVLIAQRQEELARELVEISDQAVNASRKLLDASEVPRVALLQTQVEAGNARIVLSRAENAKVGAWRRLTSVLAQTEVPLRRLAGDPSQIKSNLNWDEQLDRLLSRSPELAAVASDLERARSALKRAHAEVHPDVDVRVTVQQDTATDDTITGIQIGLPIPLWNRNQGGVHQARNEVSAAERAVERAVLDLRVRLGKAFQRYADAKQQAREFSDHILPKAKEALDLVTKGYKEGEIGYLDSLSAQRTYFLANLSYIEALRELWGSTILIDGLLLDRSLSGSKK